MKKQTKKEILQCLKDWHGIHNPLYKFNASKILKVRTEVKYANFYPDFIHCIQSSIRNIK